MTFTDRLSAALFNAITFKFNENHDELGRFASGDSGGVPGNSENGGGSVYYRGTNPGDTRRIQTGSPEHDTNLFVADKIEHAKRYGSHIEKITLKKSAKILKEGTKEFNKIAGRKKNESLLDWSSRIIRGAKDGGYDAVHFNLQGTIGTVILNPDIIQERAAL